MRNHIFFLLTVAFTSLCLAILCACGGEDTEAAGLQQPITAPVEDTETAGLQQPMTAPVEIIETDSPFENNQLQELLGPIHSKQALVVYGETNDLYPTFYDLETALERFQAAAPEYYEQVKDYDWLGYYGQEKTLPQPRIPSGLTEEARQALLEQESLYASFCDIYENQAKNNAILAYVTSGETLDRMELARMLPYDTPLARGH